MSTRRFYVRPMAAAMGLAFFASCNLFTGPDKSAEFVRSDAAAEGIDAQILERVSSAATAGTYGEIHSLVIIRHDRLVFEQYFRGATPDALHPVYSVTKSVLSLMFGAAQGEGRLPSLQTPLLTFIDNAPNDSAHRAITIEDGLTMRAGLAWDELSVPYVDSRNDVNRMLATADWLAYAASREIAGRAGEVFRYNSGLSLMLGRVLHQATGTDVEAWTQDHLFKPLGIETWSWSRGPGGVVNTLGGLSLRSRDMAKIGLLVLRKGNWRGSQLVPASWIATSTVRRGDPIGYGYGYQWWTHPLSDLLTQPLNDAYGTRNEADKVTIAWGWGGQHIIVIPDFDVVVVVTAGNYATNDDVALRMVLEEIAPAIH